ncbi:MAG: DUF433 domain-containing protein [Candidatus Methanomethylicaceae archaeon]
MHDQRTQPTRRAGRWPMKEIAPRIVVDSQIRFGKPVIKGTRVPVELVVGKLAGGMTKEAVMNEYDLTNEDILAALSYAAQVLAEEEIRAIS